MLDKTLLLKGVAGIATLGGVVGGGFVFKDQIGSAISGSSSGNNLGTDNQVSEGTNLTDNQDPKPGASEQGVDTAGGGGAKVSSTSTPESKEDSYGIPKTCTSSCDLTEEELKKIKFEGLGDTGDVTVENFPEEGKKISLTIDSIDTTKKKYIFTNTSDKDVKIKRGDKNSVTLKKSGKTKFTLNSKKLKERKLGDYGEPKDCTSSCTLTSTDLEDIKFKDLDGGTGDTTVSPNAGKVSLEIKSVGGTNRYIFSNSSGQEITIKKGEGKTVTLISAKKSQFTGSDNKLSKLALDDYGIPTSCTTTSPCTLTADDLGEIKFEELGGTGTVSPTNGNVTLSVETASSEKRFTFTGSSQTITIKNSSSKSVTLAASSKTRFKGNNNKLKKIEQNDKGLPSDCTSTCTLTVDDLKEIKFSDFDKQTGNVTVEPTNQTISLTITNGDDYTFNNGSDQITIKKGTATVVLTQQQGTEFHAENGKLVKGKKKSEAEIFNEKIKAAGFPEEDSCKFQEGNASGEIECKLSQDQFKVLKFKEFDGGEVDTSTLSIGDNFKVKIKKIKAEERGNYPTGTDLKFIFDGFTANLSVQKKDAGEKTIYLKKDSDTEFILDSSNQLERAWTYEKLGDKVGLSCSSYSCTVKGPINLIASNPSQKYEGMKKSGSGEAKFSVTTSSNYREGYGFKVGNSDITLTKDSSQSQTLSKDHCYQAKWDTDKWWLEYKAETCSDDS